MIHRYLWISFPLLSTSIIVGLLIGRLVNVVNQDVTAVILVSSGLFLTAVAVVDHVVITKCKKKKGTE